MSATLSRAVSVRDLVRAWRWIGGTVDPGAASVCVIDPESAGACVFLVIMGPGRAAQMRRPLVHLCGCGKRERVRFGEGKDRQDKKTVPGKPSIAIETSATGLPGNQLVILL